MRTFGKSYKSIVGQIRDHMKGRSDMEEKPMTPREAYERMMRGEDVHTGNSVNAAFARHLLRRQAGMLSVEKCVREIAFSKEEDNPWTVSVILAEGELSHDAQTLLSAMRSNAHHTEMTEDKAKGTMQITFFVYTFTENDE